MEITSAQKKYDLNDEDELKKFKLRIYRFAHNKKTNQKLTKHDEIVLRYIGFQLKPHIDTDPQAKNAYQHLLKRLKNELGVNYDTTHFDSDPRPPKVTTTPKKGRRTNTSTCEENITYSLDRSPQELPVATKKKQHKKDAKERPTEEQFADPKFILKRIKENKSTIVEHATRRTELFFLLLVAVYKTNRNLSLQKTDGQHGQSTKHHQLAACHSSLYPSIDDKAKKKRKSTRSQTTAAEKEKNNESILKGTHFFEVMNATVELPAGVNDFDSYLEFKSPETVRMRNKLLPTLQKVSNGKLTPLKAMCTYFAKMSIFYNSSSVKGWVKKNGDHATPKMRKSIKAYQQSGTFYWANDTKNALTEESVSCLLRIPEKKAKKMLCNMGKDSPHYKKIQDEILKSKRTSARLKMT